MKKKICTGTYQYILQFLSCSNKFEDLHEAMVFHISNLPVELKHQSYKKFLYYGNNCFKLNQIRYNQIKQKRTYINVTLIGPPGSGKGTYGNLFMERIGRTQNKDNQFISYDTSNEKTYHKAFLLSVGDLLRDHVLKGTDIGKQVSEYQRLGKLADDHIVTKALLESLISRIPYSNNDSSMKSSQQLGFILDGFPRTIPQAKQISPFSKLSNSRLAATTTTSSLEWPDHLRIHYAISIEVPYFVCRAKILGRRKCNDCGKSFNINGVDTGGFFMPPLLPNCECYQKGLQHQNDDFDIENLNNNRINWSMRSDDTEEIAKARYDEFVEETTPVVRYYEERGRLIRFTPYNGTDDIHIMESLLQEKLNDTSL